MPFTTAAGGLGAGALLGGAGISAGGGILSSIIGSNAQLKASQAAAQEQLSMFNTAAGYEQPFIQGGQNALQGYENALPGLTAPFSAATLPSTPGYQFTLNQGLKGTENSYAAQGLGSSGAALKGAADYATGQASNTYNQQLQNYLMQNSQIANLLYQPVQTGANAANALTGAAVGTGQGIASSLTGGGNAIAGGAAGVSNSLSGGINSALQYSLLQQLISSRANPAATVNNAIPSGGAAWGPSAPYQSSPWG